MAATLSDQQNALVRAGAKKLVARHKGNISSAARALGKDVAWLHKLINENSGGSLETATLIARELEVGVADQLELPRAPLRTWSMLPGFDNAMALARSSGAGGRYSESVWEKVASFYIMPEPDAVDFVMLLDVARLIDNLYAKKLTSGSDTSPPSAPGGQRRSSRKLRKR